MCKAPGHGQKSGSCRFRECSKCKEVGHSARECQKQSDRTIDSDVDERNTMDDANDQDADTSTMSVDGQSDDDGNSVSVALVTAAKNVTAPIFRTLMSTSMTTTKI